MRGPLDRQYGKRAETLIQSQRHHLYHIHYSLGTKLSWEEPLLMTCKTLRPFVNTLTADGKYSLLSRDNLMQPIQMHLSKKKSSDFFCAFFKSTLNFEHFQKKMSLIVYVFPKLQTPKNVIRQMSKKFRLTSIIFFVEKFQ